MNTTKTLYLKITGMPTASLRRLIKNLQGQEAQRSTPLASRIRDELAKREHPERRVP